MASSTLFKTHIIRGVRPGPQLLITAGVHGDEFEPMAAVEQLKRDIDPAALSGTVVLVSVVNESAFKRAARCGEDGKDLARTCPGNAEGSLTERVAAELSTLIRSSTHFIDLHTGGVALALVPLAGYMLHRDPAVLAVQREMAKAFGLPYVWGTNAAHNGRSLSVARDARVPAIYIEHGGGANFNPTAKDDMVRGCLNLARSLGMLSGPLAGPQSQIIVEDDRHESGHLQVQNAAPIDGLFASNVLLGDRIHAGDALGTVCSPITGECKTVPAANSGVVIMLRLIASVRAGDALAAIIDPGSDQ